MKKKRTRRGRGEAAIRKLPSGSYEARITIGQDAGGKRIRKNLYAISEEALRLKIAQEQRKLAHRPRYYADAERITLAAFISQWLESEVRVENRRATYVLREATCRNHIVPHLGTLKIAHIEDDHVRGLLLALSARGVRPRTRQVVHATLHRVFQVAVRDKLVSVNPVQQVERPRAPRTKKRVFNDEEANIFLDAAWGDPYYPLYVLAITTGMREGELFALYWSEVDLDQAAIHVYATLTEDDNGNLVRTAPKTESSVRTVELPKIAVEALREHRVRTQGFEGFVFRDTAGGPLRKSNFLRRNFKPLLERARTCEDCNGRWMRGIDRKCPACGSERSKPTLPKVTFHTLRHVANSLLLARGVNIKVLADRLGHSTTRTTMEHYSHVLTGAQREAANALDAIFLRNEGEPSDAPSRKHES